MFVLRASLTASLAPTYGPILIQAATADPLPAVGREAHERHGEILLQGTFDALQQSLDCLRSGQL